MVPQPGAKPLRSLLFQARRQIEELAHMSKGCSECMNGVGIVDCLFERMPLYIAQLVEHARRISSTIDDFKR